MSNIQSSAYPYESKAGRFAKTCRRYKENGSYVSTNEFPGGSAALPEQSVHNDLATSMERYIK